LLPGGGCGGASTVFPLSVVVWPPGVPVVFWSAGGMFVWAIAGNTASGKLANEESISIFMFTIISCSLGPDEVIPPMSMGSLGASSVPARLIRNRRAGVPLPQRAWGRLVPMATENTNLHEDTERGDLTARIEQYKGFLGYFVDPRTLEAIREIIDQMEARLEKLV
jgi:hypothetical protein